MSGGRVKTKTGCAILPLLPQKGCHRQPKSSVVTVRGEAEHLRLRQLVQDLAWGGSAIEQRHGDARHHDIRFELAGEGDPPSAFPMISRLVPALSNARYPSRISS